jgi:hypothetical protein
VYHCESAANKDGKEREKRKEWFVQLSLECGKEKQGGKESEKR